MSPLIKNPIDRNVTERRTRAHAHVTKIFNFPVELADELREEAIRRSQTAGFRITEKEIIIKALKHLLSNPNSFPDLGCQ